MVKRFGSIQIYRDDILKLDTTVTEMIRKRFTEYASHNVKINRATVVNIIIRHALGEIKDYK